MAYTFTVPAEEEFQVSDSTSFWSGSDTVYLTKQGIPPFMHARPPTELYKLPMGPEIVHPAGPGKFTKAMLQPFLMTRLRNAVG